MSQRAATFGVGSEMLANPIRSASLPFSIFFSSSSSGDSVDGSSEPGEPVFDSPEPVTPVPLSAPPQSTSDPPPQTTSSTRRFLSDPSTGNANESAAKQSPGGQQRKSSRVSSLARWYERLANGSPTTPPRSSTVRMSSHAKRSGAKGASPGLHAVSLPRDFAAPGNGVPDPAEEIARLRAALQAERAARTEAEAQALSLQNALRNSKKKVDAQKQRMEELNAQLNETLAAMAPVQEILSIAEVCSAAAPVALRPLPTQPQH
jgi:hypothetical protein